MFPDSEITRCDAFLTEALNSQRNRVLGPWIVFWGPSFPKVLFMGRQVCIVEYADPFSVCHQRCYHNIFIMSHSRLFVGQVPIMKRVGFFRGPVAHFEGDVCCLHKDSWKNSLPSCLVVSSFCKAGCSHKILVANPLGGHKIMWFNFITVSSLVLGDHCECN